MGGATGAESSGVGVQVARGPETQAATTQASGRVETPAVAQPDQKFLQLGRDAAALLDKGAPPITMRSVEGLLGRAANGCAAEAVAEARADLDATLRAGQGGSTEKGQQRLDRLGRIATHLDKQTGEVDARVVRLQSEKKPDEADPEDRLMGYDMEIHILESSRTSLSGRLEAIRALPKQNTETAAEIRRLEGLIKKKEQALEAKKGARKQVVDDDAQQVVTMPDGSKKQLGLSRLQEPNQDRVVLAAVDIARKANGGAPLTDEQLTEIALDPLGYLEGRMAGTVKVGEDEVSFASALGTLGIIDDPKALKSIQESMDVAKMEKELELFDKVTGGLDKGKKLGSGLLAVLVMLGYGAHMKKKQAQGGAMG